MDIKLLAQKFYDYSLYFRGYSKDTIKRYRQVINFYCQLASIETIEQVSQENVRELFFIGRTQRGWQTNTFITFHKSLTVFFRWCQEQNYMLNNPMNDIELPKLEKRIPQKLTKQDAFKLLEIVGNYPYDTPFLRFRNHAIFSIFIFAGLRKKELLKLMLYDVDLENLTLFVNQGKGSKDRIIPISYTLAESLKKYLFERKKKNKTCPQFFSSSILNKGLTDIGLKRLVEKIRLASGIQFTIHKLRHTFATLMLEGGCDIYSLSKMMGHSDINTTTIYLAASAEHLRSQIVKHPLNQSSSRYRV